MRSDDRTSFEEAPTFDGDGPIALDGIAYGIDHLDGILAIGLRDARVHAAWVRADLGYRPDEIAAPLRDAFRSCSAADRRLTGAKQRDAPDPFITIESGGRIALLRRIREQVVAVLFDRAMPIGMARLVAGRIAAALEPELPLASSGDEKVAALICPAPQAVEGDRRDREAHTLAFPPTVVPGGSSPPPGRVTLQDLDRARRLLAYVEAKAPDAHVVRLRVALKTGLSPSTLDRPEALGAEAIVLIETAVEEILGVDRAVLRSLV